MGGNEHLTLQHRFASMHDWVRRLVAYLSRPTSWSFSLTKSGLPRSGKIGTQYTEKVYWEAKHNIVIN